MKLKNSRDVWLVTAVITCAACCLVTGTVLWLYPENLWISELKISLSLTVFIATPTTYFMAQQLRKNFILSLELQRLVDHDDLTNLATRNSFFQHMDTVSAKRGTSLVIDIDYFKKVNDSYGHFVGDEVIKHVAKLLTESVRSDDIVARFGGEEFVVFLNDYDGSRGFTVAERMRKEISASRLHCEGFCVRITVSIGGSTKHPFQNVEDTIKVADDALYRAKETGRNRTIFDMNEVVLTNAS